MSVYNFFPSTAATRTNRLFSFSSSAAMRANLSCSCWTSLVIAMLRLPEGATVDEVASVTGWQRHTVRGVFSGTLKKKLGLTVASAKEERGRVYRIAEPANL